MPISISATFKTSLLAFAFALSAQRVQAASPHPAASTAPAATVAPSTALNQKDIHSAYNEGDFDKVTALIDAFSKANKTYSRADSIFIAKHLAVVYSANPQSREKGRYYMYRLLEMMPSAELVDMFVSDEIDRIFDKVRKEFLARQKGFGVDSAQISTPEKATTGSAAASTQTASATPTPSKAQPSHSADYQAASEPFWKRNAFWIASGTGVALAGAAAVFIYLSDDAPAAGKTITIPSKTTAAN